MAAVQPAGKSMSAGCSAASSDVKSGCPTLCTAAGRGTHRTTTSPWLVRTVGSRRSRQLQGQHAQTRSLRTGRCLDSSRIICALPPSGLPHRSAAPQGMLDGAAAGAGWWPLCPGHCAPAARQGAGTRTAGVGGPREWQPPPGLPSCGPAAESGGGGWALRSSSSWLRLCGVTSTV